MKHILTFVLAVLASVMVGSFMSDRTGDEPKQASSQNNSFENIVKSGVIRCGYQYWDGGVYKNEETGELEGFVVDVTHALAEVLDLKIEWVGLIEWGDIPAALRANKIDAMCAGVWLSGKNAKTMLVSDAMAYNAFEAFVRAECDRFDENWRKLNDPSVVMAIQGNTSSGFIAARTLPRAKIMELPPLASTDLDKAINVATGKVDVAFTNPGILVGYMKANPGKIKRLRPGQPFAYMAMTYPLHPENFRTLHMINTGLKELRNTGVMDKIIEKYDVLYPNMFLQRPNE